MKKAIKISVLVLCIIIIGGVCAYFGYASTLVNPESEKSLNKHLGINSNSVITVLAQEKYKNYLGIYYKDSSSSENKTSFIYLRENKICKNRYDKCGGGSSNQNVNSRQISRDDDFSAQTPFYFIYGQNVEDNTCSVFEYDIYGNFTKKIDEISVPDDPFVVVKNYNLSNSESDIFVFEGKVTEKDILEFAETENG